MVCIKGTQNNSDFIIKKLSYLQKTYNGEYKICQNTIKNLKSKFPNMIIS